ncbi:MAG TPA: DNA adenine methylase [Candidatus Methylacidiphilales bacterium]|nr:DNA adenine methylase [Candidatus Methylacidiphilales bacterium]
MVYTLEISPEEVRDKIVNVASVPQLSPFRYPGGKTWLVPTVREWLKSLSKKPSLFVDPFAGGGIVPLTVIAEKLAERVLVAELDPDVASVWRTALSSCADKLRRRIISFEINRERVIEELNVPPRDDLDRAFKTLLRNRTQHGGILAPGASLIKTGEGGRGVASRWYPETLCKRIQYIQSLAPRIRFVESDAMELIPKYLDRSDAVFFIDPPYTVGNGKRAGRRLYSFNHLDHDALFDLMASVRGNFMMTYDHASEVVSMAKVRRFNIGLVPMKNTHHARMFELIITKKASAKNRD